MELENIEEYSVPLDEYISKWFFEDEDEALASEEHKDQIFPLTKDAANFLWELEMNSPIYCSTKFFKTLTKFDSQFSEKKAIKKFLYNIGIPFNHKVYISHQPDTGFVLTWKMVIKYSHNLFGPNDQIVSDKSMNWKLEYHHDGEFTFGNDLIFNFEDKALKDKAIIDKAFADIAKRKEEKNC
jgi:hypothetical protein